LRAIRGEGPRPERMFEAPPRRTTGVSLFSSDLGASVLTEASRSLEKRHSDARMTGMRIENGVMEEIIIRSLQNRATAEEEARLHAWRAYASDNDREYRSIADLWRLVETARPAAPSERVVPIERVIARAEPGIAPSQSPGNDGPVSKRALQYDPGSGRGHIRRSRLVAYGLLAASISAVCFGLGAVAFRNADDGGYTNVEEFVTSSDAGALVTLSDGTAVRLAPNSNLRVIDRGENPVVRLQGRAYFGVVPDSTRTFTVQTAYGEAVALGTRFEVQAENDAFRVVVAQGNVRVSSAGSSVEIARGMMSSAGAGEPLSTLAVEDVDSLMGWMGRTLVFRATSLTQVIEEIEHRFGVPIVLEDPALGDLEITASFAEQPLEDVIHVVCRIVGAGCALGETGYRIGDSSLGSLQPVGREGGA